MNYGVMKITYKSRNYGKLQRVITSKRFAMFVQ